jgi:prophage tail gpP-like protein
MPRPIPGKPYIVVRGDTFENIALRAYGDARFWTRIYEANQIETVDELFLGRIILIPYLPEDQSLKTDLARSRLANRDKYDLTIIIDDIEILPFSARIRRQLDTAADGWTASIAWIPGEDKNLDRIVKPYSYLPAAVYIGGDLLINGLLYNVSPRLDSSGSTVDLAGWSYSVDAVDSVLKPPYERRNETLKEAADILVRPLGIRAVFDVDPGEPFARMTAEPTETIFSHLAKYASQRAQLISSTPSGDLLFLQANTDQQPLGTIEETRPLPLSWAAKYDGRKLFNVYRAIGQSPGYNAKAVTAIDDRVPRSRFLTFTANDTVVGDIQTAAEWRRSKQLAAALTIPFPVADWYSPAGELWQENKLITVVSDIIGIPKGYTFLIKSVEFEFAESGQTATLNLVPPEVYTGEKIVYPW